ncbi:hypothetical protein VCHE46_2486A, partial [Vibrio cholerae HE-46]
MPSRHKNRGGFTPQ